jgi:hypothetical protein
VRWHLLSTLLLVSQLGDAGPLELDIRGQQVRQPIFSVFAQPGETLRIGHPGKPRVVAQDGVVAVVPDERGLVLTAPEQPGHYTATFRHPGNGDETLLNLWVSVPRSEMKGEYLNGYRIGTYPPPRPNRPNYRPPEGFFEVTADNVDTRLSPNFTMRQFLCKQESDYPKYVVVQERLLVMLEGLLADVQAAGYDIATFGVISGYRTPYYNRRIGNVPYSRHVYGDAMDFFIDVDGDGRMDDVNRDGMHNAADIQRLFGIVETFMTRPENRQLLGGIGRYNKTSRHGGFVHVDTRGYQARW